MHRSLFAQVVILCTPAIALLISGCGSCTPPVSSPTCTVAGERYEVGDEISDLNAPAGCDGCVCEGDGDVDCPADGACVTTCTDVDGEKNLGETWVRNDLRCSCSLDGQVRCDFLPCQQGEERPGGCGEVCTCDVSGQWICPDVFCCAAGGVPDGARGIACQATCLDDDGVTRFQGEGWTTTAGQLCSCDFDGAFCRDPICEYLGESVPAGASTTIPGCGTCACGDVATFTCDTADCLPVCEQYDFNGASLTRLAGETWPVSYGTCTCTARGVFCCSDGVECQELTCDDVGTPRSIGDSWLTDDGLCRCTELLEIECNATCAWEGVGYEPGATVPVDGCSCTCGDGGNVTCTDSACLPTTCPFGNSSYSVGLEFGAGDGCNQCVCSQDGVVYCTERACEAGACEYAGTVHSEGDSFPSADGCNTCTCGAAGQPLCTQLACAPIECFDGTETRAVGDTFPSADGCELCTCSSDGQVYCTARCSGAGDVDAGPTVDAGPLDAGPLDAGPVDAG